MPIRLLARKAGLSAMQGRMVTDYLLVAGALNWGAAVFLNANVVDQATGGGGTLVGMAVYGLVTLAGLDKLGQLTDLY